MEKKIQDVMSKEVRCCGLNATIPDVAHIMTAYDVSAVVVLDDDGYIAGIISRIDLVALRGSEGYWHGLDASHVMKTDVITCSADRLISEASKTLVQKGIHRLIVVENAENDTRLRPVGVLSQTDIVRDMALGEWK